MVVLQKNDVEDDADDDVGGDDNGGQIFLPSPGLPARRSRSQEKYFCPLLFRWIRSQEENAWNPFLSHPTTSSTWHCNHNEDDDDDGEEDDDDDDRIVMSLQ